MNYDVEIHVQKEDDPEGPRQVLKSTIVIEDAEVGDFAVHDKIEKETRARVDLNEGEIIRSLYITESLGEPEADTEEDS